MSLHHSDLISQRSQLRQGHADPIHLAGFLLQDSTNIINPSGLGMQQKTWHNLTFQIGHLYKKFLKKRNKNLQNPSCRKYPFISIHQWMNFIEALGMGSACLATGETSIVDRDGRTL
jgi:hypothetical protein